MAKLDFNLPHSSIAPYARTITCATCGQFRAYILEPFGTAPAVFQFCPVCGVAASQSLDLETDMLEMWSRLVAERVTLEGGNEAPPCPCPPASLMKLMYEAWDWREHTNFVDYATKMLSDGAE